MIHPRNQQLKRKKTHSSTKINKQDLTKKNKQTNQKVLYFSLVGWMKQIASMDGNGCLLLYISSTTGQPKKKIIVAIVEPTT